MENRYCHKEHPSHFWRVAFIVLILTAGCGGGGDLIPPFTLNDSVALGDLNGDGRVDIALVTTYVAGPPPHPGSVSIYVQDPSHPGAFSLDKSYSVGNDPWHVAIADMNGDNKLDIIVANTSSNDVSVLLQDPASPGRFLPALSYACGTYTNFVAIGDLNGDGRPDMAAAHTGGVALLYQDPVNPGRFFPATNLSTPSGTSSVAIGALNSDSKADLVATTDNNTIVFMQDPASPGLFLPPVAYSAGPRASSAVIHDIDNDGLQDLVIVNAGDSSGGGNSSISIRLQDPAQPGNFLAAVNYPSANGARSVAVADLDGDGRPDLAVAAVVYSSQGPGIVQVFSQNPALPGRFLSPSNYDAGSTPQSIAIADLNFDGKPDLADNEGPIVLFQDPSQPGKFFNAVIPVH